MSSSLTAHASAPFALLVLLGALLQPGCGRAGEDACVAGSNGCLCTAGAGCDPGLTCTAGICVSSGSGGASGMNPPGGGGGRGGAGAGGGASSGGATWTVFVYAHADHNLSSLFFADLFEMTKARLNDRVKLIVLVDWNASDTIADSGEPFPQGAFWYDVRGNGQELVVEKQEAELDFDDPAILAQAVSIAFKSYPADRYGLILWDHGGGWRGGFGGDWQDGSRPKAPPMAVETLARAVGEGVVGAGLTGARPLDFVAFDTCLMSGVEVMAPFESLAKVFIANAEIDYGRGWDYENTFSWLAENSGASLPELVTAEAALWDAHHKDAQLDDALLRAHAGYDTAKIGALSQAVARLGEAVRRESGQVEVARAMFRSQPAYKRMVGEDAGASLRDIADVLLELSRSKLPGVAQAAAETRQVVDAARMGSSRGSLRQAQVGLHLLAGPAADFSPEDLTAYPTLAGTWERASGWGRLLGEVRAAVDGEPPIVEAQAVVPAVPSMADPPRLTFRAQGADTVFVEGWVSQVLDPGVYRRVLVFGEASAAFVGPGQYDFNWRGKAFVLEAQPTPVACTVWPWVRSSSTGEYGAPLLSTNGVLSDGQGSVQVTLLFDPQSKVATHALVLAGDLVSTISLEALVLGTPGVTFTPTLTLVDTVEAKGSLEPATLSVPVPADGRLRFAEATVGAGQYLLSANVYDAWGNGATDAGFVTLAAPLP